MTYSRGIGIEIGIGLGGQKMSEKECLTAGSDGINTSDTRLTPVAYSTYTNHMIVMWLIAI